jgi:hypothetical protein
MKVEKDYLKKQKEKHIHSPAHALADELSVKLNDKSHFGFYLRIALTHNHDFLRRIAGEVLENKTTKKPGALFSYLVKKGTGSITEGQETQTPNA